MNRTVLFVILMASLALGAAAQAQPAELPAGPQFAPAPAADNGERFQRNLEQWRQMTPEQRAKIRQLFERWKNLTEEERQRIRQNFERFRKMQQDKQQAILRARQMMSHLQEKAREQLERRMREIEQMPPERRQLVMQKLVAIQTILREDLEQLQALPPTSSEARQLVVQTRWKAMILHAIPPEMIERLKAMPPEARQDALQRLLNERRQMFAPNPEGHRPRGQDAPRPDVPHRPMTPRRPRQQPQTPPEDKGV